MDTVKDSTANGLSVEGIARPRGPYRAISIGALLVPINVLLLLYMEIGTRNTLGWGAGPYPSTISLFGNTILFLVALTAVNALILRCAPRLALHRSELLITYVMLVISTAIVSIDFLDVLVPMMTHTARYATPENHWAQIVLPYISPLVSVQNPEAVKSWYEGNSSLTWAHAHAWAIPVAVWSGVIFVMLGVMFCINTLVRQQWMQNEKLLFPIIELPMQITEPGHQLFRSKLMWIGFGIAFGISVLNGLALSFPNVPSIPVKMQDISILMTQRPWNAIGWTPVSFYPYAIGLGFLLPLDMLFSCWFFFLMWRVIRVLGALYGVEDPNFPYMNQQALGGYYLVATFALWSARPHLHKLMRVIFNNEHDPGEAEGPMRYRTAFFGMVLGTMALVWFFAFLGIRWWVAAIVVGIYFFLALAVAKMHAEFGPPAHDLHNMGPEVVITGILGTRGMPASELAGLSWFWWFNRAYRSLPIAYQLDGMKLGQRTNTHQRHMMIAMALASVIAVISGFWIYINFGYQRGVSAGMAGHVQYFGVEAFGRLERWISTPTKPDVPGNISIAVGMGITYFLYMMKLRVWWWPLHPLGFAISTSYSIGTLWLPLMIAWLAKSLIFKFGGLKSYKIAMNFFLGLILGDFIMGCLWPILGCIFGIPTYSFMQ